MQTAVTGTRIAKNTTFYIAALTIQKALSFLYFVFIARSLGAALTGKYFFALSVAGIVIGIVDIGLTPALTREVARDHEHAKKILWHTLYIKAALAVVLILGLIGLSGWIAPDAVQRHLIYIALAIAVFDTVSLSLFATVRAFQNLWYESISAVVFQVTVLCAGGIAMYQHAPVTILMCALLLGSMVNCAIGISAMRKMLVNHAPVAFDQKLLIRLLYLAAPFAVAMLCIKANAYTDTILVKALLNDTAVGLYSVAYKITFAFQFIPMAFVASLYPAFTSMWHHDRERLPRIFVQACTYLLIFSVPVVAIIAGSARVIIPLVYRDEFAGSVMPLILLCASLPLLFINFPIGSLLNAIGRQNRQTLHLAVGVVATVFLNVILIPLLGITGAAIASLISTTVVFVLGIMVAQTVLHFDSADALSIAFRILLSGALCYVVIRGLLHYGPWYIAILAGVGVYVAGLWVQNIITHETLHQVKALLKRA